MNLTNLVEYYEADDDRLVKQKPTDSRKIRLTLRHLNKLRKMKFDIHISQLLNATSPLFSPNNFLDLRFLTSPCS